MVVTEESVQKGEQLCGAPILFRIFNRPEVTQSVFGAIRKVKPSKLYVAGDGARAGVAGESEKVRKCREISTNVDWACEVRTLFWDENVGGPVAGSEAISWFFEHEEAGIILEDDNLPHPDFFRFCEILLSRYQNDERVWAIAGNNFLDSRRIGDASYYFSKYFPVWGWASWRRAWKHYERDITFWPVWRNSEEWKRMHANAAERRCWSYIFERIHRGEMVHWDYSWIACLMYHDGVVATPNVNLVTNIGYGPAASNTRTDKDKLGDRPVEPLGEICHPKRMQVDPVADQYVFDRRFGGRHWRFPRLLLSHPRRLVRRMYRKFRRKFLR